MLQIGALVNILYESYLYVQQPTCWSLIFGTDIIKVNTRIATFTDMMVLSHMRWVGLYGLYVLNKYLIKHLQGATSGSSKQEPYCLS